MRLISLMDRRDFVIVWAWGCPGMGAENWGWQYLVLSNRVTDRKDRESAKPPWCRQADALCFEEQMVMSIATYHDIKLRQWSRRGSGSNKRDKKGSAATPANRTYSARGIGEHAPWSRLLCGSRQRRSGSPVNQNQAHTKNNKEEKGEAISGS